MSVRTERSGAAGRTGASIEHPRESRARRHLLLAAAPAVLVGILIRAWLLQSPLLAVNADEAITGLQGYEILHGRFRLIVSGNDYGSTTESYLVAPLLTFWSGVWPLRIVFVLLSILAAYALFRLARPLLGSVPALGLGLTLWTMSSAVVVLFSHMYMGYPTGFIAEVATLALACHAMRSHGRLARTAACAGLAAGFAIWSHPMFGVVALLALVAPSVHHWRRLRAWWLSLALGGIVGVSPWMVHIARSGRPSSPGGPVQISYVGRMGNFVTELLPRAFGLRTPDGTWIGPPGVSVPAASVLVLGGLVGLVLLVNRKGSSATPLLVAGVMAFPSLALFNALGFYQDARYSLPFLPMLLMGLGASSLLLPSRVRASPWLLAAVPTIWAVLLCVPVLRHETGWELRDPDTTPKQVAQELRDRDLHYLAGDYWGAYLVAYFADEDVMARADGPVRLDEQARSVESADPARVALIYSVGLPPALKLPLDQYEVVTIDHYVLYLPLRR